AVIKADYSCQDTVSGVASCSGTVPDGSPIDTGTLGSHSFSVTATNNAGTIASLTVHYTVGYAITTLPGSTTTVHQGYYAVIRFAPMDANGHDYASRNLKVSSVELDGPNGQVIAFVHPFQYGIFNGKPGYQLSFNTRNLATGTWTLKIQIGSGASATTGSVAFTVE
ncbi:MAG TPA: hypothetical protein VKU87_10605, partial [Thermomicrobiaceae bacterium]|nr:hypothetical protein [Thermomicrobiaceae bacterium]